jgi:eukaryotic-like serine/threonine-protein kinase
MPPELDKPRAADLPGIYHFKFDLLLGRGGTGSVYRAIDTKSGEIRAVKIFRADFFRNRLHVKDLAKTVKRFRKMKHPNVVRIHEFIQGDDGECLVMEYVDGPSLRWYIANRPWNLKERIVICAQICNGLQYIHERGFTHHDFKPANVLFTRKGQVKLSDFSLGGTAFLLELFDKSTHEQVTPMYIAPELINGEKATAKSDMYSMGVTMYIMFTGEMPYQVDNLKALYHCHLRTTPFHPTDVNRQCPRELGDIIMKLMAKDPDDRYRDCDQVRIAIADIGTSRI